MLDVCRSARHGRTAGLWLFTGPRPVWVEGSLFLCTLQRATSTQNHSHPTSPAPASYTLGKTPSSTRGVTPTLLLLLVLHVLLLLFMLQLHRRAILHRKKNFSFSFPLPFFKETHLYLLWHDVTLITRMAVLFYLFL